MVWVCAHGGIRLYKRETPFVQDKWPPNNCALNFSKTNHTLIAQREFFFKGIMTGDDGSCCLLVLCIFPLDLGRALNPPGGHSPLRDLLLLCLFYR